MEQVKMPKTVQFKSIRDSLVEPEFVTSDFAKMDRERQLLVGMQVPTDPCIQPRTLGPKPSRWTGGSHRSAGTDAFDPTP
jgi:hypothetical protein